MKTSNFIQRGVKRIFQPEPKLAQLESLRLQSQLLPTLWLLGKTGAGKSSLVKAILADEHIDIGLGFKPCTQRSHSYDYPTEAPLFRFLDTRGLGEADYDPTEDVQACCHSSNLILVVMKLDDPEQSSVLEAFKNIKRQKKSLPILIIHTGADLFDDPEDLQRSQDHQSQLIEQVLKQPKPPSILLDLRHLDSSTPGMQRLFQQLQQLLPIVGLALHKEQAKNQEGQMFAQVRSEILWYAGIAGGSDALPVVGLISVPSLQAKMLHSLARQYGIDWGRRALAEFFATLGAGFGLQYSAKLGIRQLVKMIPVYGQTVGAASAAALSFSSTYALGRAAAYYLYARQQGEPVSQEQLRARYEQAFKHSTQVDADDQD